MISIILYGRNDNHGYNYHKRLAISLNCIAEVLSNPQDEIIFVDYNTPNELPTILEAIQDTLTDKAKSRIRILRVRPSHHKQFLNRTTLPLLEPIARNIAIRRSNPSNRWILSTNVDMIFVPDDPKTSLTEIVAGLKDGFYILPRLELPENFWELSLERSQPQKNISFLRENSGTLHLNTIIRKEGFIQYDNPGDFQLMLREDIFTMGGFDEEMLKGWHVDSNLNKRMSLLNKQGDSLEHLLKSYHCNHTHQESFLHSKHRTQNDWNRFVSSDKLTPILNQPNWGLAQEKIEEIFLQTSKATAHLQAVLSCLENSSKKNHEYLVSPATYNSLTYSSSRIFIYLSDHLCNLPENSSIAYFGYNPQLLSLLETYFKNRNWPVKIFCPKDESEAVSASLYIFDFGFDELSPLGQAIQSSPKGYLEGRHKLKAVMKSFFKFLSYQPKNKIIGINVTHTDMNVIFSKHLSVYLNAYITGISYGYWTPKTRAKQTKTQKNFKKKLIFTGRYFVTRYLFDYSDKLREFALRFVRM